MFRKRMKSWKAAKARSMRLNPTPGEAALWKPLQQLRSRGLKFRRQVPCRGFILDFYCPSRRLCVEVDGPSHIGRGVQDFERDKILWREGSISTLRVSEEEAVYFTDKVVARILSCAMRKPTFSSWNAGVRYRLSDHVN